MMELFRAIRTLTRRREELKTAVAEHSSTVRRLERVADDISRGNRKHADDARLERLQAPTRRVRVYGAGDD